MKKLAGMSLVPVVVGLGLVLAFYGVTWYGSDSQGNLIPGVTCNYHTNVYHALQTAPYLANFLATLTNGPTVLAAHSLGNMVCLSAISDWNAPVSKYFMIDAAVSIEAVQGNAVPLATMYSSDWFPYADRLNSHEWHNLFSAGDGRNALTWTNRLASFHGTDVYNFYSSGEEVLRNYTGDPPSDLLDAALPQIISTIQGAQGSYVWVWQEKAKGRAGYDTVIGSRHGGWRFNPYYNNAFGDHMDPSAANVLPNSQLQTNAFFGFDSWPDNHYQNVDFALYGAGGSQYAQTNRNRILSDAIPAITLPVGANPVPKLSPPLSTAERNFNLNTTDFKNGWPLGRTSDNGNWHHSDFREVAYTFTHPLFDDFVTFGNLQ